MEENKKKIIAMTVTLLALLVIIVGATYAYFVAQGGDSASKNVTVTTDTTDSLTFSIGRELKITADQTSFAQGQGNAVDTTVATAKLIAGTNRTPSYDYYMYLDISKNEFSYTTLEKTAELILTVLDPDDNPVTTIDGLDYVTVNGVSGFDITEKIGLIEILNHTITTSGIKVEDWDVTLTFVNLDSDQNSNTGKQFAAELKLQKDKIEFFAEHIKKLYTTNGVNNLYLHDSNLANSAEDGSYRYSGPSETTNNFVCFGSDEVPCPNDDLYRIIGVFEDQVKLIKADYATTDQLGTDGDYKGSYSYDTSNYKGQVEASKLGGYYYNYNGLPNHTGDNQYGSNNWETSLLNKVNLNTNYINYLNRQNPKWANMIAETKWNIGGHSALDLPAKTFYNAEIMKQTSETSKIGLMQASDYGYATLPSNWSTNLFDYDSATILDNNWMYMGLYEWTITPNSSDSSNAFNVYNDGSLYTSNANHGCEGRPVLYLKADVTYVKGKGSVSNPLRIN